MNFKGKKILVTGATGGIGGAIIKKFLSLKVFKFDIKRLSHLQLIMSTRFSEIFRK